MKWTSAVVTLLASAFVGCGFQSKSGLSPTDPSLHSSQCSESYMDDMSDIFLAREKFDRTKEDKNLRNACAYFHRKHSTESCDLVDGQTTKRVSQQEIINLCEIKESGPSARLVKELSAVSFQLKDSQLAAKALYSKTEKIDSALVNGKVLKSKDLAHHLQEGHAVCLMISNQNQLPEEGQILRSTAITEESTLSRGYKVLMHLEIVMAWKEQLFQLHCEKTSSISIEDLQTSLGGTFDVSPLRQ